MKTLTMFTGETNSYCEFLNSACTPFTYAGRNYHSVEHYLLVQKAFYLNNAELAGKMLEVPSPEDARYLAAMLYGSRERLWNTVMPHVAHCGIRAKFQQHPKLYKLLRATAGRMLVYAERRDPFWGTGCEIGGDVLDGQCDGNLLGRVLMQVRVELKEWKKRGALGYDDVGDHPEFVRNRVMRYEFDQLLDNVYTRQAVWPYVMVMAFPGEAQVRNKLSSGVIEPFIPLTTANLPAKGHNNYTNTSPSSLALDKRRPEAGYREMTQELYDLYRLQFVR